jgi:hypothetical protein
LRQFLIILTKIKMFYIKPVLILAFSLVAGTCIAQEKPKQATVKIVDFGSGKTVSVDSAALEKRKKNATQGSSLYYHNQVVSGVTNFSMGYADIGYERALTDNLSVEVGGGITIAKAPIWRVLDAFFAPASLRVKYEAHFTNWESRNGRLIAIAYPASSANYALQTGNNITFSPITPYGKQNCHNAY